MVKDSFCFRISKNIFLFFIFLFFVFFYSVFPITGETIPEIPKIGEKAPFFESGEFNSKNLLEKKNLIIVFYRGHF
tara:strand:+ start:3146 stop:3373 length:228 start_codon:yes stop_codon:yes gene_type:complete